MRRPLITACVFAVLTALGTAAYSQSFGRSNASAFGSGMGTSGFASGMGSSGFGGSGFGGMGSGGFGGSNAFSAGGLGGGFGSNAFGGGGFGSNAFGSGGFGNSTFGGLGMGTSGSGGQNFVGRDSTDMAAMWNQMGQAGTQLFDQMNRGMNRNNNRQESSAQSVENPKQTMRVNLQIAFTARTPSPAELTNNLRTRIGQILANQNIAAPQITMDGGVVVLGGVAATESQRLVLEKLVAMEPGVRGVRNEMTVVPATAP